MMDKHTRLLRFVVQFGELFELLTFAIGLFFVIIGEHAQGAAYVAFAIYQHLFIERCEKELAIKWRMKANGNLSDHPQ